jgi:ribosomal protein S20
MKTFTKKVFELAKAGKKDEAEKALPVAFKAVDMAVKRHILHWKNAARRKSQMSKAVAGISK